MPSRGPPANQYLLDTTAAAAITSAPSLMTASHNPGHAGVGAAAGAEDLYPTMHLAYPDNRMCIQTVTAIRRAIMLVAMLII